MCQVGHAVIFTSHRLGFRLHWLHLHWLIEPLKGVTALTLIVFNTVSPDSSRIQCIVRRLILAGAAQQCRPVG